MASSKQRSGRQSSTDDSCIIGGSFAYILMITSVFGMAPLRFKSHEKGFKISLSKPMCVYSYILAFSLGSAALFGKFTQIIMEVDMTIEGNAKLTQVVLLYFHFIITISGVSGVIGGPTRMKNLIMYLNKIAKVDSSLDTQYSRHKDCKMFVIAMSLLVLLNVQILQGIYHHRNRGLFQYLTQVSLYLVSYLEMNLYAQMVYIFVTVRNRFKTINDALTLVTCQWSAELENYVPEPVNICVICEADTIVDRVITAQKSILDYPRLMLSPNDALQKITVLRGSLCDIVTSINRDCGLPIVITLLSALGSIVGPLYFGIFVLSRPDPLQVWFGILVNCIWITLHSSIIILMTDPCHNTMKEDKRTRKLLCHMMRLAPSSRPLLSLLEMFGYQVMLKPALYEPLNMCVVNRSLVVTILGAVATYLVILLQF